MKKSSIPEMIQNPQGPAAEDFDYGEAFRRNLGFIRPAEQDRLRKARIAIAGLGGVGGAQLQALARLGVGGFTLADPDHYELSNMNRQFGARMDTLGRKKVQVSREMVLAVNPQAKVTVFEEGITEGTVDRFLDGADLVLDALDFYCFKERFLLYQKTRQKGIWVLNVAPPGFGATLLAFDPKGMSFEDYFGIGPGTGEEERFVSFLVGIVPCPFPLKYLDRGALDLKQTGFPCVSPAFFMAAGIAAAAAVNLLLGRSSVRAVPWVYQWDALLLSYRRHYYPWGMRSPLQQFKKWIIRRLLNKTKK